VPSAAIGTGLANYTITYSDGHLIVTTASLTVTATSIPSKVYGTVFSGTAVTPTGLLNTDTVTSATLISAGSAATATVAAEPYVLVPSAAVGTGLGNYTISYTNGSLTVTAASLIVTATSEPKVYGTVFTLTAFTTLGLANSDTVTGATLTSTAGSPATALVSGSPYPIVPSVAVGSGLANYTITYTNGSLTVNKAALTVMATRRRSRRL
jgi:hypothetical protein